MAFRPVAKVGQLQRGDVIPIEADGIEMVLGRDGERYFAAQRRCPHQGGDLADGIIARGHLVCSHHGWRFSTATVTYPVRVNGDAIEVDTNPKTLRGF